MRIQQSRPYVIDRLKYALNPQSIAVVGSSRLDGKVGFKVIEGLQKWGYQGKIFPV